MISRKQSINMMKALAKGTWEHLPAIFEAIPATAVAGRVLGEVKKIVEEASAGNQTATNQVQEEEVKSIRHLIDELGGEAEFKKKVREELKAERDSKNPAYINCASFWVCVDDRLSEEEQQKIVDTLMGEQEAETDEIAKFVLAFKEDYFGNDYAACDNAVEIGDGYISFNFDDMEDHDYDEDDLATICEYLNKIVGRDVFDDYEGCGTDDTCGY